MDPVSHLIIGLGLATLSGRHLDISDPVYIACSVGAMIPDLDILWQLKGDLAYLKHHRGLSHSLLGNVLTAALIGGLLKLLFPQTSLLQLMLWAFVGAMSHSLFDIGNSYGAQLLYPWRTKRITINLIQIFDPVIIAIFGLMAWSQWAGVKNYWEFLIVLPLYLVLRWRMRVHLSKTIRQRHRKEELVGLVLLPSLVGVLKWDYLLETDVSRELGTIAFPKGIIKQAKQLEKDKVNNVIRKALESRVGEIFQNFTPYFHISHCVQGTRHIVRFFDLRYQLGQEFMHSATVVLDQGGKLVEQIFHPYHKNRDVRIN